MMLRPRWPSAGPMGGDGFAAPAGTCNFRYPVTFFAIAHSCCAGSSPAVSGFVVRIGCGWGTPLPPTSLLMRRQSTSSRRRITRSGDFLDLTEFQFDRRRAAEDRHCDLHARARLVDFLDDAGERCERTIGHTHVLADFEGDRRFRPLHALLHLVQDAHR